MTGQELGEWLEAHSLYLVIGWFVLLLLVESLARAYAIPRRTERGYNRWLSNGIFGIFNRVLLPLAVAPIAVAVFKLNQTHPLWHRPASLDGFGGFFLDLCALDMAGYWFHRFAHQWMPLWGFHQIHHLDEALDATTGFRVHTGEDFVHILLSLSVATVLVMPPWHFVLAGTIGVLHGLFHHSNFRFPRPVEMLLRCVITTPEFHWNHHHEIVEDTNSNYGFVLIWWDALFGTFNKRPRLPEWRMGLDYATDQNVAGLCLQPFHLKHPLWEHPSRAPAPATAAAAAVAEPEPVGAA